MMDERTKRLLEACEAQPDDPELSVYVLSEFAFCARAGVCALETPEKLRDKDDEQRPAAFSPDYTKDDLRRALDKTINECKKFFVIAALFAAATVLLALWGPDWTLLGSACATLYFAYAGGLRVRQCIALQGKLRAAEGAVAQVPDPKSPEGQAVAWWSMIKAGFVPDVFRKPLVDPKLRLKGNPWKILVHGDLCIPVWRLRSETAPGRLFAQHSVRMMAYCHLIQVCTGKESPYGVVLFEDTVQGVSVPCTAEGMEGFLKAITNARQNVAEIRRSKPPPEPNSSICKGCHFGEPVSVELAKIFLRGGISLQMTTCGDPNNKEYHSHCGDRFEWLPEHEEVKKRDLRKRR